ncbi:hypothetical protein [Streptomyces sp. NEAU-NA10]|uniref:hypothetical protein n=1 Tax=Streptomyces sp. NEAU-NA10 TaxID=3416050 RepID=UPI003CC5E648
MNELVVVSVPSGPFGNGTASLAVVMVPKLADGATLADHPALLDWPDTVRRLRFSVHVSTDVEWEWDVPAGLTVPDSHTWQTVFPRTTPVALGARPDYGALNREVHPTSRRAADIVGTYQTCARALGDPAVVRERLRAGSWEGRMPVSGVRADQEDAARTDRPIEFHQAVSILREHPALQRVLGLVVDLPLPPDVPRGTGRIRVSCAGVPPEFTVRSPATWFELRDGMFLPTTPDQVRRSDAVYDGFLDIAGAGLLAPGEPPAWSVVTFDVDAATDALGSAKTTLTSTDRAALPGLRSAGILLLRAGRDADLEARNRAAAVNASLGTLNDAGLTAEDLVLGYRLDIWQPDLGWTSVCRRTAEYLLETGEGERSLGAPVAEEAHVKANALAVQHVAPARAGHQQERQATTAILRGDEVVVRWNGWSLALPSAFARPPATQPGHRKPLPFGWRYDRVDAPQPRLRFGTEYRLRVRIADIAGGGRSHTDQREEYASELVAFLRHEPLAPPLIELPEDLAYIPNTTGAAEQLALGPGGAVHRLVIRSEGGLDAPPAAEFRATHPDYPANDRRILHPPETTLSIVELHGVLDDSDDLALACFRRASATARHDAQTGRVPRGLPDPAAARMHGRIAGVDGITILTWAHDDYPDVPVKTLRLSEWSPQRPVLSAEGDQTVHVGLRPAEHRVLELSSSPDLAGRVQAGDFHVAALDGVGPAAVISGRHPMVTPPLRLDLVHAVRKPLARPRGTMNPARVDIGQTHVVFEPRLEVDAASTGTVDVVAGWVEVDGSTGEPTKISQHVHALMVGESGVVVDGVLRQEFGDTRHRCVSYGLTASSRFRQYFHEGEPDDFQLEGTEPEQVDIPSSAPPVAPVVRSVLPTFRWRESKAPFEVTRSRFSNSVRVELATPWFGTGAGERLAVLVLPDGMAAPSGVPVTELGRDPIWTSPPPKRWPTADDIRSGGPTVTLGTDGGHVTLVPHDVWFKDKRCYADIEFDPQVTAGSYRPFLRLALARYQEHSLPTCALSSVTTTEPVTLLPGRTLTVTQSRPDRVAARLEGSARPAPGSSRVEMYVETSPAPEAHVTFLGDGAAELRAWRRYPQGSHVTELDQEIEAVVPRVGEAVRLYVREIEPIPVDSASSALGGTSDELAERVVFVDVVTLPVGPW